jgi:hypothetical protein
MILVILAVTLVRETAAFGPIHIPGTSSKSGCTKCSKTGKSLLFFYLF